MTKTNETITISTLEVDEVMVELKAEIEELPQSFNIRGATDKDRTSVKYLYNQMAMTYNLVVNIISNNDKVTVDNAWFLFDQLCIFSQAVNLSYKEFSIKPSKLPAKIKEVRVKMNRLRSIVFNYIKHATGDKPLCRMGVSVVDGTIYVGMVQEQEAEVVDNEPVVRKSFKRPTNTPVVKVERLPVEPVAPVVVEEPSAPVVDDAYVSEVYHLCDMVENEAISGNECSEMMKELDNQIEFLLENGVPKESTYKLSLIIRMTARSKDMIKNKAQAAVNKENKEMKRAFSMVAQGLNGIWLMLLVILKVAVAPAVAVVTVTVSVVRKVWTFVKSIYTIVTNANKLAEIINNGGYDAKDING